EIAGNLREAAQTAVGTAHGSDDDVGPEARAVLANTPAFVLEATLFGGRLELELRPAARQGLERIEHGKVLAQDLLRAVTLDALRAGVPARDAALRIEQENAVVLHAVDQQPEPLLAFLERILVALLLAQVLDDLGETQQRSGAVAQGGDHHAGPEGAAILAQPQRA